MAKAYFIGGAPRTGKSTLAHKLIKRRPMPLASTDDIRAHIRRTVRQSSEPDLYYLDSLNADETNMTHLMREQTADIIDAAYRESAVVWRTVEAFVRTSIQAGHDIAVEGVAVLPEFLAPLNFDYSVVYLGNQSPELDAFVLQYARAHPDTWLGGLRPETVSAYAAYSRAFSARVEEEARTEDQSYIEVSNRPFEQSINLALKILESA